MSVLKKIALISAVIIFLAVLKPALDRISPRSVIFHDNLLTGMQWLLVLGVLFWCLLQLPYRLITKKNIPWWWVLIFVVLVMSGEWGIKGAMQQSGKLSSYTHGYLQKYYLAYERELPEVEKGNAQFDPALTYTYKPNARFVMDAPEFSETVAINSAGLRDDETSASAPPIICLGDSYTVGIGVPQEQTYPQALEKLTGIKVLNAGVSSYGTARETMLFNRLDTSALECVIVQYCFNDITENSTFLAQHRTLSPSKEKYDEAVNNHKWAMLYYPLKRVLTITRMMARDKAQSLLGRSSPESGRSVRDTGYVQKAAMDFVNIMHGSGINFSRVIVLVVDMNRYPVFDHHWAEAARRIVDRGSYSDDFKKNLHFVDTRSLNDPQFYFPLDNHLTAAGHAQLARLIFAALLAH